MMDMKCRVCKGEKYILLPSETMYRCENCGKLLTESYLEYMEPYKYER